MMTIPLKSGGAVKVDDHWFGVLSQWDTWRLINGSVCRGAMVDGKQVYIHMRRVIMAPKGKQIVMHDNGDPLDCQEHNLTLTTRRKVSEDRFYGNGRFLPCGDD